MKQYHGTYACFFLLHVSDDRALCKPGCASLVVIHWYSWRFWWWLVMFVFIDLKWPRVFRCSTPSCFAMLWLGIVWFYPYYWRLLPGAGQPFSWDSLLCLDRTRPLLAQGWGLLIEIPPAITFKIFEHGQNTIYLLHITFMFDRYRHSWAVTIPVKYECDSKNLTSTFTKFKEW